MSNAVNFANGIIVAQLSGDQSYEDIVRLGDQFANYAKHRVIDKLLLEVAKVETADAGARQAAGKLAKRFRFKRVALVGASPFNNVLVTLIAHTSRRVKELKAFDNKSEAIDWLL